jgi:hypothetical protein
VNSPGGVFCDKDDCHDSHKRTLSETPFRKVILAPDDPELDWANQQVKNDGLNPVP